MLYLQYIVMHLRSLMQYRISTLLMTLGQFFVAFFSFLSISLLFERFGTIDGWTFSEVCLCFAVTNMAFAISECFARGFDMFSGLVIRGDFDRILLRPRSTLLQVLGAGFEISRIGKLLQSIIVLVIAIPLMTVDWTGTKIITLIFMISSGVAVFTGVFILGATMCFFTLEGLEFINIFTDGGRELAAYPLPVYGKWIQRFFTFIIPYGCINYLPLLYITGRAESMLYMFIPLLGILFLAPCALIWRLGVRHYTSSGS
ncbi:MAG: ABC-2 family transporter protein [Treponema sp.]|nr:ABC-2 family transporter protein [Treponema sp.]